MTVISNSIEVKPSFGRIALKGVPPIVIAVGINAVLFLIGNVLGAFPDDVLTPMGTPIQLVAVVITTLLGGIVATIGYFVLTRFLSVKFAKVAMWIIGILVLAGMFFTPLSLGLPIFGVILLEIMHFVAGLLPIIQLTRS